MYYSYDKGEPNPDDENDYRTANQKDLGFRFIQTVPLPSNKGWFKNIRYAVR